MDSLENKNNNENQILNNFFEKTIREIYNKYYLEYNKIEKSEVNCYYSCNSFFKKKYKHLPYLKSSFMDYLRNKNINVKEKNQYDVKRLIYYSSKEEKKETYENNENLISSKNNEDNTEDERDEDEENDTIDESIDEDIIQDIEEKGKENENKNENEKGKSKGQGQGKGKEKEKEKEKYYEIKDIKSKEIDKKKRLNNVYHSRFVNAQFTFEGINQNVRIYIAKSTSFTKNDNSVRRCSCKVKKNLNIKNKIKIDYLGEFNSKNNPMIIKLECNKPGKKEGYIIYNLILIDTIHGRVEISLPFSTISYKQFLKRKETSFIGRINKMSIIKYYYDGFCDPNSNESNIIFQKVFKFHLNFYLYDISKNLKQVQNQIIEYKNKTLYMNLNSLHRFNPNEASTSNPNNTDINTNINLNSNINPIMNEPLPINPFQNISLEETFKNNYQINQPSTPYSQPIFNMNSFSNYNQYLNLSSFQRIMENTKNPRFNEFFLKTSMMNNNNNFQEMILKNQNYNEIYELYEKFHKKNLEIFNSTEKIIKILLIFF
ncbi:hypothetical protein H8356DRAFT_1313515 [Neocallimastix lanati (nom. inval.)]|uniref:Uncharacterized protein n=1 Tax=Neocallimastix californiae TaxID=1754190 RepID=A0A1Y2AEI3_9FUNG|nr:hypothetical protein H8356DRAFT_1313515 [Neocallimastix sp. JGI-2020a]ORY20979.1 hypothetical protein LY90DRAFT_633132 [Neocallimastix californiae]|eukprot:ORY20979.1 hypothetical protein LY90DRAFT_633132 [Neocallimastix californiae]